MDKTSLFSCVPLGEPKLMNTPCSRRLKLASYLVSYLLCFYLIHNSLLFPHALNPNKDGRILLNRTKHLSGKFVNPTSINNARMLLIQTFDRANHKTLSTKHVWLECLAV